MDYPEVAPVGEDRLTRISQLAHQLRVAQRAATEAAETLELANKAVAQLAEFDIPEAMLAVGMSEIRLTDGSTLRVEDRIFANISQERTAEAHRWLNEHGFGNLIKREFKIVFGRDQEDWATSFEGTLDNEGVKYDRKQAVHGSTLKAFVKQQLEEGTDIPEDVFGVYRRTLAKLS